MVSTVSRFDCISRWRISTLSLWAVWLCGVLTGSVAAGFGTAAPSPTTTRILSPSTDSRVPSAFKIVSSDLCMGLTRSFSSRNRRWLKSSSSAIRSSQNVNGDTGHFLESDDDEDLSKEDTSAVTTSNNATTTMMDPKNSTKAKWKAVLLDQLSQSKYQDDINDVVTVSSEIRAADLSSSSSNPASGQPSSSSEATDISLSDTTFIREQSPSPPSPAVSYEKFLTMQEKRVVVTIRYSGASGLKPYYLTVARKLKVAHPDILVEKRILPAMDDDEDEAPTFEILVDGKIIVGKGNCKIQKLGRSESKSKNKNKGNNKKRHTMNNKNMDSHYEHEEEEVGISVYIPMHELDLAVCKARKRRRPSTSYGGIEFVPVIDKDGDFNGDHDGETSSTSGRDPRYTSWRD